MLPESVHDLAAPPSPHGDRRIIGLAAFAGLLLTIIGLRFFFTPGSAAETFGLLARPNGFQLHTMVGLRDVWLGLLAIVFAWLGEWRALALWFALGALVCFGDAGIVVAARNKPLPLTLPALFHLVSGVFCGVLAALCWRRALRRDRG
jgi:Domain of unknown function (DUF4267)